MKKRRFGLLPRRTIILSHTLVRALSLSSLSLALVQSPAKTFSSDCAILPRLAVLSRLTLVAEGIGGGSLVLLALLALLVLELVLVSTLVLVLELVLVSTLVLILALVAGLLTLVVSDILVDVDASLPESQHRLRRVVPRHIRSSLQRIVSPI